MIQLSRNSSGKTYYFINDYNYVLANSYRLCFRLAKQNNNLNGDGGPRPRVWQRLSEDSSTLYTDTFTGNYSGFTYEYISDGFQGSGSYWRKFDASNLKSDMNSFVNDYLIGERMFFLSLEFVTFEASNYFYTVKPLVQSPPLNDHNFVKFMKGDWTRGILLTILTKKWVKIFMLWWLNVILIWFDKLEFNYENIKSMYYYSYSTHTNITGCNLSISEFIK